MLGLPSLRLIDEIFVGEGVDYHVVAAWTRGVAEGWRADSAHDPAIQLFLDDDRLSAWVPT